MSTAPRIVLMTGNMLRHRYVAKIISENLNLAGVVSEGKSVPGAHLKEKTREQDARIKAYFAERDKAERDILGDIQKFPGLPVLEIPAGIGNDPSVYEWVTALKPGAVLLYGSSIIKDPLLSAFEGRIVNMHLGLSPYYRGSATNFWPLVDGLPECVGVTIHVATLKVDGGDIITQVRPENVQPTDRSHEIGNRAIIAGAAAFTRVVPHYLQNKVSLVRQNTKSGKLCRRADFTPASLDALEAQLKNGMMKNYLDNKPARDAAYPIIEF